MGLLDEFKRLAHPYEDEEDDDFEDDYEPAPRPVDRRDRDRSRDRIPERRSAPSSYYDAPSDLDSDRRSNKVVISVPPPSSRWCWSSPTALTTPRRSRTICGKSARWC